MRGFIVISILFASIYSWAGPSQAWKNPLMRICWIHSGEFVAVDTEGDQLPFCAFGKAYIGSLALIDTLWGHKNPNSQDLPMAVLALKNSSVSANACTENGGDVKTGAVDGKNFEYCEFSDGSVVGNETLSASYQSADNKKLIDILTNPKNYD